MADTDTDADITPDAAAPTPEYPLPKFFGIGWGKTGSNSVTRAMRMLGFRALHFGGYSFRNPDKQYNVKIWQAAEENIDNPLAGVASFVTNYDFLVDWPINHVWDKIHARNPHAKFIVTYREPHAIAFSCMRHNWRNTQNDRPRAFPQTYAELVQAITDHYTRIFEAMLQEPARFLTLSLSDPDEYRWRALCSFTETDMAKVITDNGLPPWPKEYAHVDYSFVCNPPDSTPTLSQT